MILGFRSSFVRFLSLGLQVLPCLFLFAASIALADQATPPQVGTDEFLLSLWTSIGGLKGLGVMGAVVVFTQLAMKFSMTKWGDFEGHWKIAIVLGLTWVSGVFGLVATQHLSFAAAFLHSTSLGAFQVFGYELVSQLRQASSSPPAGQAGNPPNPDKPPA